MNDTDSTKSDGWGEDASRTFINFGRFFVPDREIQMGIFVELISHFDGQHTVLELASGEGLLAEQLLENSNECTVIGLDGSPEMRRYARMRNDRFGDRFKTQQFDLAAKNWRSAEPTYHAVVSSLAIHHLDDQEKQDLYKDVYQMLTPGGVLLIADLIKPLHSQGWRVAAKQWDHVVKERSIELEGNEDGFALFESERWNMFKYFDPEDIDKPSSLPEQLQWLANCGFEAVDVYWMKAGHAIYGGWKPEPVPIGLV